MMKRFGLGQSERTSTDLSERKDPAFTDSGIENLGVSKGPGVIKPIEIAGSAREDSIDTAPRRRWYENEITQWSDLNIPSDGLRAYSNDNISSAIQSRDASNEMLLLSAGPSEVWMLVTKAYYSTQLNEMNTVHSLLEAQDKTVIKKCVTSSMIHHARSQSELGDNVNNSHADVENNSDALREFTEIVREGMQRGASDIHVSGMLNNTQIKYRIEGHMVASVRPISLNRAEAILRAAYANLSEKGSNTGTQLSFETQQRTAIEMKDDRVKLRFQITPRLGGFHCTMRIMFEDSERFGKGESLYLDLVKRGYLPDQARRIALVTRKSAGGIIVAGVTGSGKTISLYTILSHIATPDKQTFTVEDPVEGALGPHVSQIQVNITADQDADKAISEIVKAILRMDPDTALVSEIRGKETGAGFQEMVLTGHRSLSTVHTGSGIDIYERLASSQIGIPRHVLSGPDFLSLLIYQALLRRLCDGCKIPLTNSEGSDYQIAQMDRLGIDPKGVYVTNHEGCDQCRKNPVPGVAGRTLCAEVITPSFELLALLKDEQLLEAYKAWRKGRAALDKPESEGKTAYEVGIYKMSIGQIDPSELEAIEPIDLYLEKADRA